MVDKVPVTFVRLEWGATATFAQAINRSIHTLGAVGLDNLKESGASGLGEGQLQNATHPRPWGVGPGVQLGSSKPGSHARFRSGAGPSRVPHRESQRELRDNGRYVNRDK